MREATTFHVLQQDMCQNQDFQRLLVIATM